MPRFAGLLLTAVVAFGLAGCGHVRWPRLVGPGPIAVQRYEALEYDPYPENDLGPPVVGVRPPGYEEPMPEPARSRFGKAVPSWLSTFHW